MKRYLVSGGFVFTVTVAVISMCLWIFTFVQLSGIRNETIVTDENVFDLENGQIVRFSGNHLLIEKGKDHPDFEKQYGQPVIVVFYVGEKAYIRTLIKSKDLIDVLDSYKYGEGAYVSFRASVVTDNGSRERTRKAYDTHDGSYDPDKLVTSYTLKEFTEEEYELKANLLFSMSGFTTILALFIYFTIGGIKIVYDRPFEDSRRYKKFVNGVIYDLEAELRREKEALRRLKERQTMENPSYRKRGYGLTIGGGVLAACCLYGLGISTIFLPVLLISVYFIIWGIRVIWDAYLNSPDPRALRYAEMTMKDTIPVKIKQTEKCIAVLEKRLEKSKKEKELLAEVETEAETELPDPTGILFSEPNTDPLEAYYAAEKEEKENSEEKCEGIQLDNEEESEQVETLKPIAENMNAKELYDYWRL